MGLPLPTGCSVSFKAKYPKSVIAVICPEFQSRFYSDALTALQVHAADGTPVLFTDYYSAGKDGGSFASWLAAAGPLPAPAGIIWQSR